MTSNPVLTVGGVQEQVNVPWHMALDQGLFDDLGVDVRWDMCPGGTGEMSAGLASGRLDIALVLTEGITAHIAKGGQARIIGTYVATPLIWGIHVDARSKIYDAEALRGQRYGISRMGSGSHLMAFVDAAQRNWPTQDRPKLVKVGGMDGAIKAFEEGQIDGFMWEKFTTKPMVDAGRWRRVDESSGPWPAFVIAARPDAVDKHADDIAAIIERVGKICARLSADPVAAIEAIAERHPELEAQDVRSWLSQTRWVCAPTAGDEELRAAGDALVGVGVLEEAPDPEDLIDGRLCKMQETLSELMYSWRVRGMRNALAAGDRLTGPLRVKDLTALGHLDQYHYYGAASCDEAARLLGFKTRHKVLDAGSGIGGPARYLAHHYGVEVVGVEKQSQLVMMARELTQRCALGDRIRYITGDLSEVQLPEAHFDHAISMLVMLYLDDRAPAWKTIWRALRSGGTFLIEDLTLATTPTPEQQALLDSVLVAPNLVDSSSYRGELLQAEFVDVHVEDMTALWRRWTELRYQRFMERAQEMVVFHGEEVYEQRRRFYKAVRDLFAEGVLGGLRATGRKPGALERHLKAQRQQDSTLGGDITVPILEM